MQPVGLWHMACSLRLVVVGLWPMACNVTGPKDTITERATTGPCQAIPRPLLSSATTTYRGYRPQAIGYEPETTIYSTAYAIGRIVPNRQYYFVHAHRSVCVRGWRHVRQHCFQHICKRLVGLVKRGPASHCHVETAHYDDGAYK